MTHASRPVLVLFPLLAACAVQPSPHAATGGDGPSPVFVENAGQWPGPVRFRALWGSAVVWVEDAGMRLHLRGGEREHVVRLAVEDAGGATRAVGEAVRPGVRHFFRGGDAVRDVRAYGSVRLCEVREGLDLRLRRGPVGLEYDLLVAPGADLDGVVLRCEGARLRREGEGIVLETPAGTVRQTAPLAWEEGSGGRRPVRAAVRLLGEDRFAFTVERVNRDDTLVVDPGLDWGTFLGGSAYEWGYGVAGVPGGGVVVVGETASPDFPTTAGVVDPTYNGFGAPTSDAFVTRLDAQGALVWSTYLGGGAGDSAKAVAVDGSGVVTVVGGTQSRGFPTTPGGFDGSLSGFSDGFASQLSADGKTLRWSTFVGGGGGDGAEAVAAGTGGEVFVAGVTSSSDFPTSNGAHRSQLGGTSDAYVMAIASNGSLQWSTQLGGSDGEVARAVTVAGNGEPVVVGVTSSPDFATAGTPLQSQLKGNSDAFALQVPSGGGSLSWSTLLGGTGGEVGRSVAVLPSGELLVTGVTDSGDFPTHAGAHRSSLSGSSDAFAAILDGQGSSVRAATLFGGSGGDVAVGGSLHPGASFVVGGQTDSADFPTTAGALQTTGSGQADGFIAHLAHDLGDLVFGTYVGGSGADGGEDMLGPGFRALLVGVTNSQDFPTSPGAVSTTMSGGNDAFAATLTDVDAGGTRRYGSSTPACGGPQVIGVSRQPLAGNANFAVTCTGAPPGAVGFLAISASAAPGVPIVGITAWIDPNAVITSVPAVAGPGGFAEVTLPLTNVSAGVNAFLQFAWFNTPSCGGAGTLSASDAIELTVQ